jgi:hypothetical protein
MVRIRLGERICDTPANLPGEELVNDAPARRVLHANRQIAVVRHAAAGVEPPFAAELHGPPAALGRGTFFSSVFVGPFARHGIRFGGSRLSDARPDRNSGKQREAPAVGMNVRHAHKRTGSDEDRICA